MLTLKQISEETEHVIKGLEKKHFEGARESIEKVLEFLNGSYAGILKDLEQKMLDASENMDFERAIEYRELLNSVKQVAQKQKITSSDGEDKDIIALAADDRDAADEKADGVG